MKAQTIKVICAWCKKFIKEKPYEGELGYVSHGICQECFDKQQAELNALKSKWTKA